METAYARNSEHRAHIAVLGVWEYEASDDLPEQTKQRATSNLKTHRRLNCTQLDLHGMAWHGMAKHQQEST